MNASSDFEGETLLCPLCSAELAVRPHSPPFASSCRECSYSLWCCQHPASGAVVLEVVADVTPEQSDVDRLCDKLVQAAGPPAVVIDLSDVRMISSMFMARLVAMNKRIRASQGQLVLCRVDRIVLDTLHGCKLDKVFQIADDVDSALKMLA